MKNLKTRIQDLEKKLIHNETNIPLCVLIRPESGRKNVEPDTSDIIRLISNGVEYDREQKESEEAFVSRVAGLAKSRLKLPGAISCLQIVTENTIDHRN